MTAYSGAKTGRSPLDKRIVKEESSDKDIWWGPVNKPMTPEVSFTLFAYVSHFLVLLLPYAFYLFIILDFQSRRGGSLVACSGLVACVGVGLPRIFFPAFSVRLPFGRLGRHMHIKTCTLVLP